MLPRNSLVALIVFGLTFRFLTKFSHKFTFITKHLRKLRIVTLFMVAVSLFSIVYNFYKTLRSNRKLILPEIPAKLELT
jgi:hypothetical protein